MKEKKELLLHRVRLGGEIARRKIREGGTLDGLLKRGALGRGKGRRREKGAMRAVVKKHGGKFR